METQEIKSRQGVDITFRVVDDGASGVPLVFSGGLGGTYLIWSKLVKALRKQHKIVIWDYPGLSSKQVIDDDVPLDIKTLADYQAQVLDTCGIERACLIGWSLGPQVALEHIAAYPDRICALIAICGVDGRPFDKATSKGLGVDPVGLRSNYPAAVGWVSERLGKIEKFRKMLRNVERPTRWAKRIGLVDPDVDDLVFDAVIRDFLAMDPHVYGRYIWHASEHDASSILENSDVPLLAVSGERDRIVPARMVKLFASRAKRGEYFQVKGGTHFIPLEYSQILALKIENFLEQVSLR